MALLNKNHVKSLVSVGTLSAENIFVCDSTSFLIGFLIKETSDTPEPLYRTFLVTNRHVFENRTEVFLRFNTEDGNFKTFRQPLVFSEGETLWLAHPNKEVDLALLNVDPYILKNNSITPSFINEEMFAYFSDFEDVGISVGDDVYVIGFPMGIAGDGQNFPCVKSGVISRIDSEVITKNKAFMIDSSIFPGNSGGPVILKPTIISLDGTVAVGKPFLLGVVSGYIPYIEQLFTHQTNPAQVVSTSRENSGLSYCVPLDYVRDIYNTWLDKQKKLPLPQKNENLDNIDDHVKASLS